MNTIERLIEDGALVGAVLEYIETQFLDCVRHEIARKKLGPIWYWASKKPTKDGRMPILARAEDGVDFLVRVPLDPELGFSDNGGDVRLDIRFTDTRTIHKLTTCAVAEIRKHRSYDAYCSWLAGRGSASAVKAKRKKKKKGSGKSAADRLRAKKGKKKKSGNTLAEWDKVIRGKRS